MFQHSTFSWPRGLAGLDFATCRRFAFFILVIVSTLGGLRYQADGRILVTNAVQFHVLRGEDYLEGCDFHLAGVVTLVNSNRDLVVLQDATGAVALHFRLPNSGLSFGQQIYLEGTNCCPYFDRSPNFPYYPSLREVRSSFEAPSGCGNYYLTRMRGYLHPPLSGEYNFWIASDNSSELWLSTDDDPSKVRKIAFIQRFGYVMPHDWSHYPSQRSDTIWLQEDKTYYIEAFQEQTTVGDNLSVAWQGPQFNRSVIDGRYLNPFNAWSTDWATNGILREFWTNFTAGDLSDITGARPFQSALTVENVSVRILGQGQLPEPDPIDSDHAWHADRNYRWVTSQGFAKFVGVEDNAAFFELAGNSEQIHVFAPLLNPSLLQKMHNALVQVEGVCEGTFGENGNLIPGKIWVSDTNDIHILDSARTNISPSVVGHTNATIYAKNNPAMQGFYSTRGIVTFNDRVLNEHYLVVQEDEESAFLVSGGEAASYESQLKVGEWADFGGALQPGKYLPVLSPLVITRLGWHSMPVPITDQLRISASTDLAGKWSELEGMVHSVNTNGLLSVVTKEGPIYLWIGQTSSNELARYVDAKLCVRGVLLPNRLDNALLLVPSRKFVDVEEPPPEKPFEATNQLISELAPDVMGSSRAHRVKVTGEITYREGGSFFLQDPSSGIRVINSDGIDLTNGEMVEVLGFPGMNGSVRTLTEAQIRPVKLVQHMAPNRLDLSEALSPGQDATLIVVNATLLAQKTNGDSQVLELQEQQRVFTASLAFSNGRLPKISPGSRVQIVGVCDNETMTSLPPGEKPHSARSLASLEILMRSPSDLAVIRGPPWWTWERTMTLIGTLLAVIAVTLLWIYLLRRRLERQQTAQLEFSRRVLERLEDERRRIAVNLHDSLGQILLAIKNQAVLAIQRPSGNEVIRQRLDNISTTISQAIEEIRHITHGLRPYQLDRLGLAQAIRASVSRASENSPISFAVRVEDIDGLFDKDAEIHVYRIVQEAVTNVVKHSMATEAAVVIRKRTATVSLSIRDNGQSFNASKPLNHSQSMGFGLSGIAERVRILGGTFTIDSRPGEGTSLTIEIPL